ncbi:MAG: hypothetical protein K5986_04260 [Clostridium sp.]|uniref:hypothetical protein n=1 Tax=Clostridium sp. DSM 8431 TaxID=1761781 RepID=UPI0008F30FED|nr:hypothetical protein [Clostridium sp. DSM 8431]MCR4943665.1 hypothetical protein [Clostridium sp.]SFU31823.1 hypothetical protein SAMN04487886_100617 [Clostridium sp. DSM 8431]
MEKIAMIFILCLCIEYFKLYKKLLIKTVKSKTTIIITALGMIVVAGITLIYAKSYLHFFLGVLGILLLYLIAFIEGITDDGLCIIVRGKYFYKWNEIGKIDVMKKDTLCLTIYNLQNAIISKQNYSLHNKDKVIEFLHKKHVELSYVLKEN